MQAEAAKRWTRSPNLRRRRFEAEARPLPWRLLPPPSLEQHRAMDELVLVRQWGALLQEAPMGAARSVPMMSQLSVKVREAAAPRLNSNTP